MGYIEEIKKMDLADDVKDRLIAEHTKEVAPLKDENLTLKSRDRRESVEAEVKAFNALFGDDGCIPLAKYVRRVLLSGDAEEPGAILLSDNEMGLSGDVATGATGREEVSVAGVVRKMIELMPRAEDGRIALSDQGIAADEHGRPGSGDEDEDREQHKANLKKVTGRTVERTRSRYARQATVTTGSEV